MKVFCNSCHDIMSCEVKETEMSREIKGKVIYYKGKKSFCSECKEEVFVETLLDYNLEQLDNAYRDAQNLIKKNQIQDILDKYDIGKRPLSQLLGWGELTLSRYLEGALPTKQYSDTLLEILQNTEHMDKLLESNKQNITDRAYSKCKLAISNLREPEVSIIRNYSKIDTATKYLISNLTDVTPLALQKLLYYSQGFFIAFNDKFLFENDCEAWIHGPVYKEVYYDYKDFRYNPIENTMEYDCKDLILESKEKEVLDSIIKHFGCYSGKILEKMTHCEMPWIETRKDIDDNEPSNKVIQKTLINNYFTDVKAKFNMLNLVDINDYSKDLFNKLF